MPKKFDSQKDIPDLQGKVILVTGGNAGIGEATVRALAAHNPTKIILCARKTSNGNKVVETVHQQHPNAKIDVLELDLSSFDSVKKCAAAFNEKNDRLDILFLNAGVAAMEPQKTKEGYEYQFGVNHMGHALFTQLLMPKMLQTVRSNEDADARIVLTSSIAAMRFAPKTGLALDQMRTNGENVGPMNCYGNSKLANVLFAKKLAQLYPSITTTSYHPGTVASEIWGKSDGAKITMLLISPIVWLTSVSTDVGAKTGLWCGTAAKGKSGVENGGFYFPTGVPKEDKNTQSSELCDSLWKWTDDELAKHGGPGWPDQ